VRTILRPGRCVATICSRSWHDVAMRNRNGPGSCGRSVLSPSPLHKGCGNRHAVRQAPCRWGLPAHAVRPPVARLALTSHHRALGPHLALSGRARHQRKGGTVQLCRDRQTLVRRPPPSRSRNRRAAQAGVGPAGHSPAGRAEARAITYNAPYPKYRFTPMQRLDTLDTQGKRTTKQNNTVGKAPDIRANATCVASRIRKPVHAKAFRFHALPQPAGGRYSALPVHEEIIRFRTFGALARPRGGHRLGRGCARLGEGNWRKPSRKRRNRRKDAS